MAERGWSYMDLERESGHRLSRGRWQQLGSGLQQRRFPDPATLVLIAEVLDVDVTTVVLAAAQALGLGSTRSASGLAQLLPAGTDRLPERMRDAILNLIRAAVSDSAASERARGTGEMGGLTLEWPKSAAPSRRQGDDEGAATGADQR